MNNKDLPKDFMEILNNVTAKRARFVIDTILRQGYCSTEDLKKGGYEHAPRAARDVRELGIPLVTEKMKDSAGKTIAVYKFGDWEKAKKKNLLAKTSGRSQLSNKLKDALVERYGSKCHLYGEEYPKRLLQPDHRIPYEIGGDPDDMMNTEYFMLLCPSANRDKSWACEHCPNWENKDYKVCKTCYYAFLENYTHIACNKERKLDIIFRGEQEIKLYQDILLNAEKRHLSVSDFAKRLFQYYEQINRKK